MDLRQLRYFTFTIENGSLTRAAAQLNIAQPALSVQIRQLEKELGIQLLVRHSRGVEATAEGEELYKLATDLLRNFADLRQRMFDLNQTSPSRVVVGMTPSVHNIIGVELVARAARMSPPILINPVDGMSTILSEWLSMERVDLAIIYHPLVEVRGVRSEPLLKEELWAFGVPRMFPSGMTEVPFRELAELPLVLPALKAEVLVRTVLNTAKKAGISLNIAAEVQSMGVLREYVLSGDYTTILPYGVYFDETEHGLLRSVRIVEPSMPREMHFAYSDRRNLTRAEWTVRRLAHDIANERAAERPSVWTSMATQRRGDLTP